jgi:hypothetical protein
MTDQTKNDSISSDPDVIHFSGDEIGSGGSISVVTTRDYAGVHTIRLNNIYITCPHIPQPSRMSEIPDNATGIQLINHQNGYSTYLVLCPACKALVERAFLTGFLREVGKALHG